MKVGTGPRAREVQIPVPLVSLTETAITLPELEQVLGRHASEIAGLLRISTTVPPAARSTSIGEALAARARLT